MSKGKRTHMQKIRESIYRMRLQHSLRQISKDLLIHRSILRNIRNVAKKHGWLSPEQSIPDDHQLHLAFNEQPKQRDSKFESCHELIQEWNAWSILPLLFTSY